MRTSRIVNYQEIMDIQGLKDESMDVKPSNGRENGNFDLELCNASQTSKVPIDSSYEFKSNMYIRLDCRKFVNNEVIDDKYIAEQECVHIKQLNSVITLSNDKPTSIIAEESNCTQKYQQDCNKENLYLMQKIKSLESDIVDLKLLRHNDKCSYELLRANKLLIEIELTTTIEMNEMLETQIQNMIQEKELNNKPIYQFCETEKSKEKDVLEHRNETFTNSRCTMKNVVSCVRKNCEQKLQLMQKAKTQMKKNVTDKFGKLKRTWTRVCKKLNNTFKKSRCTEETQQEVVLKLNEEICKNKKINEKYNNLKDNFIDIEKKLVCMTEVLAFHDQKRRDTVSLNDETYMKKEMGDKYKKLKMEWMSVCRKLNDVEHNLQLTSFKLKKETNMKEKIIDQFGELKQEYMRVRENLENTTQKLLRMEQKLQATELNMN